MKSLKELAASIVGMDLRDYNFDDLTVLNGQEQPVTVVMTPDELREFFAAKREEQMGRRTWNG